jgi:hypothetical protein
LPRAVAEPDGAAKNRSRFRQRFGEYFVRLGHRQGRSRSSRPKEVPMIRREFVKLTVGSVVALGGSLFFVSCGGGSSGAGDDPAAPPQQSGTQIIYTTSVAAAHFHTFGIDTSAFASPPAGGVSGATSDDGGHTHSVAVSMADLQSVGAGQTVKVTTGSASGHTHVLTLVKVA